VPQKLILTLLSSLIFLTIFLIVQKLPSSIRSEKSSNLKFAISQYRNIALERQRARFEKLVDDSLISEQDCDAVIDERAYQGLILGNALAKQKVEEKFRTNRIVQIA